MSDWVVQTSEVVVTYTRGDEQVHALNRVSVQFRPGELVALVGRSGSGKTTLLNVLAGWESPESGAVRWSSTAGEPPGWDSLAMLPQALGLIEELTIGRNVRLPIRLMRTGGERPEDLAERLAADLGLEDIWGRYPPQTSIGEQQRCALARSMVLDPGLLLVDEPTAHQDRGFARTIFDALEQATRRGSCVVVATHDEELAARAERVLYMVDGEIAEPAAQGARPHEEFGVSGESDDGR